MCVWGGALSLSRRRGGTSRFGMPAQRAEGGLAGLGQARVWGCVRREASRRLGSGDARGPYAPGRAIKASDTAHRGESNRGQDGAQETPMNTTPGTTAGHGGQRPRPERCWPPQRGTAPEGQPCACDACGLRWCSRRRTWSMYRSRPGVPTTMCGRFASSRICVTCRRAGCDIGRVWWDGAMISMSTNRPVGGEARKSRIPHLFRP